MNTLTLADLTHRLGQEPSRWTFLGQCYDAGEKNLRRCAITLEETRICFTLKLKSGAKGRMTISPEAIEAFERWNPDLYVKLKAGLMFLELRAQALAADVKATADRKRVADADKKYNAVYKEAKTRISNYRASHRKEKLPEYLEALKFLMQRTGHYFEEEGSRALSLEQKTVELEKSLIEARAADAPVADAPVAAPPPATPVYEPTELDSFCDIPEIF